VAVDKQEGAQGIFHSLRDTLLELSDDCEVWPGHLGGSLIVRALHTPGHRPEHTVFALADTARGPEPWAVLSGDTMFVGDIARPD
jgi:glyoxylase-like metal-dependent hydrolase (beta-lactamase superfamily II)